MSYYENDKVRFYVPTGIPLEEALKKTTHLCIAAHQDDLEIMASHVAAQCMLDDTSWFTGIVVTDGSGSPRQGRYANFSEEDMRTIRHKEQCKAADIGEYAAVIFLDYPSKQLQNGNHDLRHTLRDLFSKLKPSIVYTHNIFDKHLTHLAVSLYTINMLRELPINLKPEKVIGGEVWGALDWLTDQHLVFEDASTFMNIQCSLIGVYDSQISGGKDYLSGILGRRRAHATFNEPHAVDKMSYLSIGQDMTALIHENTDIISYVERALGSVRERIVNDLKSLKLG